MDIRKLQRVIVDALEDVKAQHIVVFNTEEQSPLFERVIVASGTSNRQTKALASSVRDAVKGEGFPLPRVEGEDNGEWIIVDCGAAVVHVMQPDIRTYYHLEEIWGAKPVRLKLGAAPAGLVKASVQKRPDEEAIAARKAPAKKAAAKKAPAAKKAAPAAAKKAPVAAKRAPASKAAVAKRAPAAAPAAKKAAPRKTPATVQKIVVGKPAARAPAKKASGAAPARPAPAAKKTRTRS
jgi:ribosome-associated protein